METIFSNIIAVFVAMAGIAAKFYFDGKRQAKNEQNEQTKNNLKTAREIEKKNANSSRDNLIDGL